MPTKRRRAFAGAAFVPRVPDALPVRMAFPGPNGQIVRYRHDCPNPGCRIAGAFGQPLALADCDDRIARCRRCNERARLVPPGRDV